LMIFVGLGSLFLSMLVSRDLSPWPQAKENVKKPA
jgi:hypothetical protein